MDKIINHAVLSLDFWQDTVTYEGCAMPTGTIGCEVLNISAEAIETLTSPCDTMNRLLQGMNTGTVDLTLLPQVQGAASGILSFMDVTRPFSRLSNSSGRNWRMFSLPRIWKMQEIICSFPSRSSCSAP